jgi:hypothetical protein
VLKKQVRRDFLSPITTAIRTTTILCAFDMFTKCSQAGRQALPPTAQKHPYTIRVCVCKFIFTNVLMLSCSLQARRQAARVPRALPAVQCPAVPPEVCVCMYVCMNLCMCMHACMYVFMYLCPLCNAWWCLLRCVYLCMYEICMHEFMYVCMYLCPLYNCPVVPPEVRVCMYA